MDDDCGVGWQERIPASAKKVRNDRIRSMAKNQTAPMPIGTVEVVITISR
jgi:hypothetical protein